MGSIGGGYQKGLHRPKGPPDPFQGKPPKTGGFQNILRYNQIIPLKKINPVSLIRRQNFLPSSILKTTILLI
jgi:hypothetical protein